MPGFFSKIIEWIYSFFWKEEMEITLVGLNNSGKTSLVNLISSGNFAEEMIPTIGFQMRRVTKGNVSIKLWDLGGQKRFRSMWGRYCRGVDVIIFMVDAADEDNFDKAVEELLSLVYQPQLTGIPLLILGNKSDLPGAFDEMQLIERMNLDRLEDREISCYSISCKEKDNIDTSLQWIVKHRKSQR